MITDVISKKTSVSLISSLIFPPDLKSKKQMIPKQ